MKNKLKQKKESKEKIDQLENRTTELITLKAIIKTVHKPFSNTMTTEK